mgnify:CR=1 FL=1
MSPSHFDPQPLPAGISSLPLLDNLVWHTLNGAMAHFSVGSESVRRFAPGIAQPTLLIAAEKDDITPIEAERHLQTLFPRAELVEIPDVGHLIHYETPQQAAAAIRRFLRPSAGDMR